MEKASRCLTRWQRDDGSFMVKEVASEATNGVQLALRRSAAT
jgi:hypothetical protein